MSPNESTFVLNGDMSVPARSTAALGRARGAPASTTASTGTHTAAPDERPRFLSEADCHELLKKLARFSTGGGLTNVLLYSIWKGNVRWARNQISTSGEVSDNNIVVQRGINGMGGQVRINDTTDAILVAAARRAERLMTQSNETAYLDDNSDLVKRLLQLEPATKPQIFSEATYQLDADKRAAAALELTKQARDAGMLSAGYIEVAAVGMGVLDTLGRVRYCAYTQARYSVTVRDPKGTGSGWAGVDWYDWNKIDAPALTARALDKCLKSRNPVAIEPGRYTTILEPQAVSDFVGLLIRRKWENDRAIDRYSNECDPPGPFRRLELTDQEKATSLPYTKLGEKIVDERITISADPMDPEMAFPPFSVFSYEGGQDVFTGEVYHPATWIEHGVLKNLAYKRDGGIGKGRSLGMPNSGAFRMSGGDTSVEEMIATTKRGLLVTRFDQVIMIDFTSQLYRGYTRDGLWLIENGKISHPVKNMVFTESILFALNNLEQLGPPQRVFNPNVLFNWLIPQPVVVPPIKVKDFSFTALCDAV